MKRLLEKNMKNNKKGSTAIFLTMILISMITAAFAFVHASQEITQRSINDGISRLAGKSILAEYNIPLKDRYGIFAFYGQENTVQSKLQFYMSQNCKSYIFKPQINVNLRNHVLMDADVFEEQIITAAQYGLAASAIKKSAEEAERSQAQGIIVNSSEAEVNREINNQVIINSLPSKGVALNGIDIAALAKNGIPSMSEIFKTGTDNFFVNTYIFQRFGHGKSLGITTDSYFLKEVEYILYGKLSDEENETKFLSDFVKLRTGLNLIHIYSDPMKVEQIVALAEVITPGPGAIATQAVLASAWAYAEALNDKRLLLAGERVMAVKTKSSWALGLQGAVDGVFNGVTVKPESGEGLDYEGYLKIFLYLEKRETKLLRTMDLIQINMKYLYDKDFLIQDYNTGVSFQAEIGGDEHAYTEKY